jgi:hypothetical protein
LFRASQNKNVLPWVAHLDGWRHCKMFCSNLGVRPWWRTSQNLPNTVILPQMDKGEVELELIYIRLPN